MRAPSARITATADPHLPLPRTRYLCPLRRFFTPCDRFATLLATTRPLRGELQRALPDRPFGVRFWDGSELPASNGGGPSFSVRSPAAMWHALSAPGQLGLGRAYVSGELEVDD